MVDWRGKKRGSGLVFARATASASAICPPMSVLVVGSIALDDIKTPLEEHSEMLGGSASYGCVAASFYSPVNLVGIVGEDFPKRTHRILQATQCRPRRIENRSGQDLSLVGRIHVGSKHSRNAIGRSQRLRTFHSGVASDSTRRRPSCFSRNIAPDLQHHVLDQVATSAVRYCRHDGSLDQHRQATAGRIVGAHSSCSSSTTAKRAN